LKHLFNQIKINVMKSLLLRKFIIAAAVLFSATLATVLAQGTGKHFTMYLDSCKKTANTLQFDMFIVSDGAGNSDLRMNGAQFGLNFNTGILQSGANISPSYINGTTDPIFPNQSWCFPGAISPDHIRATQEPCSQCNAGNHSMIIGHRYRMGRFLLTSSANWVNGSTPDFTLQSPIAVGKTVCEALVYNDTAVDVMSIYTSGTTDSTRSLSVNCNIVLSVDEITGGLQMQIYPNPSIGLVLIRLDKYIANGIISIFDVLGTKVYSEPFSGNKRTIDLKLSAGVYFLDIYNNDERHIQKIIVQ
jgi:hypothetical protein